MANKVKGEVSLNADGKTYILRLSINAICELEDAEGKGIDQIARELVGGRSGMRSLRRILKYALKENHGDLELEAVGSIMSLAGFAPTSQALGEAFQIAFPEPKKTKGGEPLRPRKAMGGSPS